jgi:hypothetical protein
VRGLGFDSLHLRNVSLSRFWKSNLVQGRNSQSTLQRVEGSVQYSVFGVPSESDCYHLEDSGTHRRRSLSRKVSDQVRTSVDRTEGPETSEQLHEQKMHALPSDCCVWDLVSLSKEEKRKPSEVISRCLPSVLHLICEISRHCPGLFSGLIYLLLSLQPAVTYQLSSSQQALNTPAVAQFVQLGRLEPLPIEPNAEDLALARAV